MNKPRLHVRAQFRPVVGLYRPTLLLLLVAVNMKWVHRDAKRIATDTLTNAFPCDFHQIHHPCTVSVPLFSVAAAKIRA